MHAVDGAVGPRERNNRHVQCDYRACGRQYLRNDFSDLWHNRKNRNIDSQGRSAEFAYLESDFRPRRNAGDRHGNLERSGATAGRYCKLNQQQYDCRYRSFDGDGARQYDICDILDCDEPGD